MCGPMPSASFETGQMKTPGPSPGNHFRKGYIKTSPKGNTPGSTMRQPEEYQPQVFAWAAGRIFKASPGETDVDE